MYNLKILCLSVESPFLMHTVLKVHSKGHLKVRRLNLGQCIKNRLKHKI